MNAPPLQIYLNHNEKQLIASEPLQKNTEEPSYRSPPTKNQAGISYLSRPPPHLIMLLFKFKFTASLPQLAAHPGPALGVAGGEKQAEDDAEGVDL